MEEQAVLRSSMRQIKTKLKFQTKYTKLNEKIIINTSDKLTKTETQNEGCCSTDDPHPPRQ